MRSSDRVRAVGLAVGMTAIAAAALGAGGGDANVAKKRKPVGQIELVDNFVDLRGGPLRGDDDLFAGDLVATREGGGARFRLKLKGISCIVHDRSRVSVRPAPKFAARLRSGEITCATNLSSESVEFRDGKRTRVSMKDPVFSLVAQKRRTVVKVLRGVVIVTARGGASDAVAVGRNQQTVVPAGRAPEPVRPARFTKDEREANAALESTLPKAQDSRPPRVTIGQRPDRGAAAVFTFSSDEPRSTFSCELDLGGFHPCASPFVRTLQEGRHVFAVRAVDPTGNVGEPATHEWVVNLRAPVATLTKVPPALSASSSASFSFTADEPKSTFRCSLDGNVPAACTSPSTYSALSNGTHSFTVIPVDEFGLAGGPVNYSWTIDFIPPTTFITGAPQQTEFGPAATFWFVADESPVTFECELDGGGYQPCTSPKQYFVGAGTHVFRVRATDAAGNVGQPAQYSWVRIVIT